MKRAVFWLFLRKVGAPAVYSGEASVRQACRRLYTLWLRKEAITHPAKRRTTTHTTICPVLFARTAR